MSYREQSFIGSAIIYGRKRGTSDPFRDWGNFSAAQFGITTQESTQTNYRGGGGEINKLERITGVTLNLTATDFNSPNIAMAVNGDASTEATAAIAAEAQAGADDGLIRTDHLIDVSQSVTVTDTAGPTVLTEGTDYTISPAGIKVISGGAISAGISLEIDYTSLDVDIVEALMNSGYEYELVIDGLNEAQSGQPCVLDVWRWKPSPTQGMDVIGSDYGSLALNGAVLQDSSKSTGSQYFRRTAQQLT